MPPKKQIPAPIDRPLSRAYLREFTGWSTAYPPTLSDATSLRVMENVMINRDGSARVRPGLRYVSYEDDGGGVLGGLRHQMVGTHEAFFLNDTTRAYLFAVREDTGKVGFRVMREAALGMEVRALSDVGVEFSVPQGLDALAFSEGTTYVKYLQIDNKIFALSDNGEPMRYFTVGEVKTAKVLGSVERPLWEVADKLSVIHPNTSWINSAQPTNMRTNKLLSPGMDAISGWGPFAGSAFTRSSTVAHTGTYSGRLETEYTTLNMCPDPAGNPNSGGTGGWGISGGAYGINVAANALKVNIGSGSANGSANSRGMAVQPGGKYQISFDLTAIEDVARLKARFVFYNSGGGDIGAPIDASLGTSLGRKNSTGVQAPTAASSMRIFIRAEMDDDSFDSGSPGSSFSFKNVLVNFGAESITFFDGNSGANYYWLGAAHHSPSANHPPRTAEVMSEVDPVTVAAWVASLYVRAGSTVRNATLSIEWRNSAGGVISTTTGTATPDSSSSWTRLVTTATAPAGTVKAWVRLRIPSVAHHEYHYLDSAMFEAGAAVGAYFDGDTPDSGSVIYKWTGAANASTSTEATYASPTSLPLPVNPKTAETLISSVAASNEFNFAFFYTFNNEIGDSAVSQVTVVRCKRAWTAWKWETPNAAGEPAGPNFTTTDPGLCADQLTATVPVDVFNAAINQGATHWNLYMFTWSDQDPMPVTAMQIGKRAVGPGSNHAADGWMRATPQMADVSSESVPLPQANTRYNYSNPTTGGQGIVASDRLVIVADPNASAVIRWTSNQMGSYTDFSAIRGGGYKTLTSGNMQVAATVKLWQNPQSVDTLTILTLGVDGNSTGYYMQPAQVASQSEAVNIMGFEETTATPGTTAVYGCEVLNNALFHPIYMQLMKSTASNYNINHKAMTDNIADDWKALSDKDKIVSSHHDNRIYYLVYNRNGAELEDGCRGNEVWVLDTQAENGHWSRWLVQGHSLRKIGQDEQVVMSLMHPSGLYFFDEYLSYDEIVDPVTKVVSIRHIAWQLETNTQGANKAHDAWCHLQQLVLNLGNFQGKLRYGIRSHDIHGKDVEFAKIFTETHTVEQNAGPFHVEDHLLIRRDLKEWVFFAGSVVDELGENVPAYGQINLIQYRYTPSTVNTGYEYGSIETFEYGRAAAGSSGLTDSGVPQPVNDHRHPVGVT